jgi:SAM-dependent methyltransferase
LAREALPAGGSVLDVGCGGGRAALAIAPPASTVIGVDEKPALLAEFAAAASRRGLPHIEIEGRWPDVASRVGVADVAVCHHVAYNVAELGPFALALAAHARRRVVMELSWHHPLTYLGPLWRRFWDLDRPAGPTALAAAAVLREVGLPVQVLEWTPGPATPSPIGDDRLTVAEQVEITRIRLCLGADRDPEIAQALAALGPPPAPRTVALWWDVPQDLPSRSGK